MAWFQLIRWKNLVIIFITQFLAWWCVILPLNPEVLDPFKFGCLCLSTLLIAAAGYIINDYFDIKIDLINRPEKVVLERVIPRKQAITSHVSLNLAAVLLAGLVAVQAHHLSLLIIQLISIMLLWFYSTHFKRMFMTGNVVVALLTALTIVMFAIYEPSVRNHIKFEGLEETSSDYLTINPLWMLCGYAFFAFMLTWIREIVKDLEDLKGDTEEGCTTMPVKWGIGQSINFVRFLGVLVLAVLSFFSFCLFFSGNRVLSIYLLALIIIPLAVWLVSIGRNFSNGHFHKSSARIKLIMLSGIFTLIIYYFVAWTRSF